ncbi:MAG: LysE family translocator [Neomegalonema sp.]|nr:LysE family translocator [Neomegalonema sp.]
MTLDAFPLAAFAFATSITPGPNNLMLMASGARFGLRRTTPHLLGVTLGFGVLTIAAGLGVATMVQAAPEAKFVMQAAAAAFVLYLAWKIISAHETAQAAAGAAPLSFLQAAAFQWINPKGWAMALTAITAYTPSDAPLGVIVAAAAVFCVVNFPCVGAWAAAGVRIFSWLKSPGQRRVFNWLMAGFLVASMAPIVL